MYVCVCACVCVFCGGGGVDGCVWFGVLFIFIIYMFVVCLFLFSITFFVLLLSLMGTSGRLTWIRHSSRKSSATHSYRYVYSIFVSPDNGMAASVLHF